MIIIAVFQRNSPNLPYERLPARHYRDQKPAMNEQDDQIKTTIALSKTAQSFLPMIKAMMVAMAASKQGGASSRNHYDI